MGQSDTESTSSSMHGNPGSPRDPSAILYEELHGQSSLSPCTSRARATSPSTSSDSSELDNSVIFTGERPKSRQRDIPFIDLTAADQNDVDGNDDMERSNVEDAAQVNGMYSDFAARVQRQLHVTRERLARMRTEHHRLRLHALRSRMQNCPYITTFRSGRRPTPFSTTHRQRPQDPSIASTSSGPVRVTSPITISDSPVASESNGRTLSPENVEEDASVDASQDVNSEPYHHSYHQPEHRYAWRRRLSRDSVLQRLQDRSSSCNEESDEALARRLQAQFDQELADEQPQLQEAESSFLTHAPPDLAAGPLPLPLHYRRRRHCHRRHGISYNLTSSNGLPDLLLPFVSMTSLPPPLHHFDPVQNHGNENEDYEALWNLTERIGPAKSRGLNKEAIDRIPSFRYSTSNKEMSNGSCVVCMMDYNNREKLRKLPCTHDFHSKCIDRWLKNNRSCPVCREVVGSA